MPVSEHESILYSQHLNGPGMLVFIFTNNSCRRRHPNWVRNIVGERIALWCQLRPNSVPGGFPPGATSKVPMKIRAIPGINY